MGKRLSSGIFSVYSINDQRKSTVVPENKFRLQYLLQVRIQVCAGQPAIIVINTIIKIIKRGPGCPNLFKLEIGD